MTREELVKALTEAGNKYDGHVTEGSMQEQMKVVDQAIDDAVDLAFRDGVDAAQGL